MKRCGELRRELRRLKGYREVSRKLVAPVLAIILLAAFLLPAVTPPPVSASVTVVSPDGWGWQNPLPQGNNLDGVWGSSSSDVFAVGAYDTILHYSDKNHLLNSLTVSCL
jgi:hypothetical protein